MAAVPGIAVICSTSESYCLGDRDRSLFLTIARHGVMVYSEGGPPLPGMAFRSDGERLYIQRCVQGATGRERSFETIDLTSGARIDEPHPSDPATVVMLLELETVDEELVDLGNERCYPAFVLSRPLERSAQALSAAEREAALEEAVAGPPSEEAWRDLMAIFRGWTGPEVEEAAERAARRIAGWQARWRKAPPWLDWLEPHPAWRLVPAGVQTLELKGRPLRDDGLARLLAMPQLAALSQLSLVDCEIGPNGARALAGWAGLSRITHLDLDGNPIASAGAEALASSPRVERLARLGLTRCGIDDRGVAALAGSAALAGLRVLTLDGNPTSGDCGALLLASPTLRGAERRAPEPCVIWITHEGIRRSLHEGFPSFQTRPRATAAREEPEPPARKPRGVRTPRWTRRIELGSDLLDLCAAPEGELVAVLSDEIACYSATGKSIWRRGGGRRAEDWQPCPVAARVASDGRVLVAYSDGAIDLLDLRSGEPTARLRPGDAERLHGGVSLSLAPDQLVAVLCGRADACSLEGRQEVRVVAWELDPPRARWTSSYTLEHQLRPVPAEILPGGRLYLLVEERTGGGSVVSGTTLHAGSLVRGPGAAIEVATEAEQLLAIRAVGDELFVLTERSFGRIGPVGDRHRLLRVEPRSPAPQPLEPPFAVSGEGDDLACLAKDDGAKLVLQRGADRRRYAVPAGVCQLAFGADGRLWVGFARGPLLRLGR